MENKSIVYFVYNEQENIVLGRYEDDNQEIICKLDSILVDKNYKYKPKWYLKEATANRAIEKFSDGIDMSNFKIIELNFEDNPTNEIVRNAIREYLNI